MSFFDKFPIASATGVLSSIGFEDVKPLIFVCLAFIVDYGLKRLKNRIDK